MKIARNAKESVAELTGGHFDRGAGDGRAGELHCRREEFQVRVLTLGNKVARANIKKSKKYGENFPEYRGR